MSFYACGGPRFLRRRGLNDNPRSCRYRGSEIFFAFFFFCVDLLFSVREEVGYGGGLIGDERIPYHVTLYNHLIVSYHSDGGPHGTFNDPCMFRVRIDLIIVFFLQCVDMDRDDERSHIFR